MLLGEVLIPRLYPPGHFWNRKWILLPFQSGSAAFVLEHTSADFLHISCIVLILILHTIHTYTSCHWVKTVREVKTGHTNLMSQRHSDKLTTKIHSQQSRNTENPMGKAHIILPTSMSENSMKAKPVPISSLNS